jgi:thiol:disulfide interchange protein
VGLFSQTKTTYAEEIIAENYYTFTPERYAEAEANADAILLNFYADWCVTCDQMEPTLINTMSEIGLNENIYAFRVNFGDDAEISEGRELAEKFGIKTQSTYVVLKSDGEAFKTFFNAVDRNKLKSTLTTAANF